MISRISFFFFGGGGGGGGGRTIFPRSRFIKAIISIHMCIVRSSICHPLKDQTSKFFFLDFQNLKVSGSPVYIYIYIYIKPFCNVEYFGQKYA